MLDRICRKRPKRRILLVELKNVSVTYGSTGVEALSNVSLKVEDGEFAFVIGRSGAGKSTLIKLLLKELDANSGEVYVNGYSLTKMRRRKVPDFRRTIGVVFQDYRLIDTKNGERLERWGNVTLIRPDPQVIWQTPPLTDLWEKADGQGKEHIAFQPGGQPGVHRPPPHRHLFHQHPDR